MLKKKKIREKKIKRKFYLFRQKSDKKNVREKKIK